MIGVKKWQVILKAFWKPLVILAGILIALGFQFMNFSFLAQGVFIAVICFGSYELFVEIVVSLMKKQFALDYIALAAILISLFTGQFLVGAVIALMLATGQNLEKYGAQEAKKNLTALVDRIPSDIDLYVENGEPQRVKIASVKVGDKILIKKGEIISLDGILISESTLTDESSLTGEPYFYEKFAGDLMRSGTLNMGELVILQVTAVEGDSTYKKIVEMVQKAQGEKAPLIRLADKYSTFFSIITFVICTATYLMTHSLERVLAVLVVATPCPLILATPIALMGGMNACAKRRIIVKKLASLEVLSRINTIVFDKTGTITMGKPQISKVDVLDPSYNEGEIYSVAAAIERNSLHIFAKSIVEHAKNLKGKIYHAQNVKEILGQGITGTVEGKKYSLVKAKDGHGMQIALRLDGADGEKVIAMLHFEDKIKQDTITTLKSMGKYGLETYMFTGDKQAAAEKVAAQLGVDIHVEGECAPEDKQRRVQELKDQGRVIAMVGDGINDAPALALADVGMVFSNEEQTASSEAADLVFLGGDFTMVLQSVDIAKRTIKIALQSILWGIGLSLLCMVFAAFGFILPLIGAVLQELIDLAVILNSLRAVREGGNNN